MPIEIRELHIKVNVTPGAKEPPGAGTQPVGRQQGAGSGGGVPADVVSACVEQVMEILRTRMER